MAVQNYVNIGDFTSKIPSGKTIKVILLIIFGFLLFKSTLIFVPAGYVGAVYDNGRGVLPGVLSEGMSFVIPFWQKVKLFNVQLQEYTMSMVPDE